MYVADRGHIWSVSFALSIVLRQELPCTPAAMVFLQLLKLSPLLQNYLSIYSFFPFDFVHCFCTLFLF